MRSFAALAMVVVGVLSGCEEPDPEECRPVHPFFAHRPLRVALAGANTSQRMRAECKRVGAKASSVFATLADPSGNPAAFTISEPVLASEGFEATIDFQPTQTGTWNLTARFEPDLGTVNASVVVMRDRAEDVPLLTFTMPEECRELRLAGGLLACSGSALHVVFDGGMLAEGPPARLWSAGEVLWSWNEAGVTRWQGSQRTELSSTLGAGAVAVEADEARLVLQERGDLWEFVMADGGASLQRQPVLLDAGLGPLVLAVDGGWVWSTGTEVCFRGPSTQPQCADFALDIFGVEGDGFWVEGAGLGFVRFGASPRPISAQFLVQPLEVTRTSTPRLLFGDQAVTIRSDTLELEVWPPSFTSRATPTHHFGITGARVSVFER